MSPNDYQAYADREAEHFRRVRDAMPEDEREIRGTEIAKIQEIARAYRASELLLRERKLLTFTGSADYVVTLAVGFALYDSKPTILVNIPASRAEGADLDPALLRVAKIIKK